MDDKGGEGSLQADCGNWGRCERSRRDRPDKSRRSAALERLRSLNGSKNKCDVNDVQTVWTEVNENDYSALVQKRQDEDWIVDDDGVGYVEDGREIFDDEYEGNVPVDRRSIGHDKRMKNVSRSSSSTPASTSCGPKTKDLKSMFTLMPTRKKFEKEVRLEEDTILDSILVDLHSESSTASPIIEPTLLKKKKKATPVPVKKVISVTSCVNWRDSMNVREPPRPSQGIQTPTSTSSKPKFLKPRLVLDEEGCAGKSGIEDLKKATIFRNDDNDGVHSSSQCNATSIQEYDADNLKFDFDEPMEIGVNVCTTEDVVRTSDDRSKDLTVNSAPIVYELQTKHCGATFADNWDDICGAVRAESCQGDRDMVAECKTDSGLPLNTNESGDLVLNFFWLDAYEDHFRHPGVVYLFGKIQLQGFNTNASCCVIVQNIERKVLILPRDRKFDMERNESTDDPVTFADVYKEVSELLTNKWKMMQFRSRKVQKNYCFDRLGVPEVTEYLELKYSAQFPQLPSDLKGRTFSDVFGTNTSSLELLLLDRRIMGPCWLEIKCPQPSNPQLSWCKTEIICSKLENISVLFDKDVPPITILSLGLKMVMNAKSQLNEIVAASCLVHHKFPLDKTAPKPPFQEHFCALTRPSDGIFPFDFKDHVSRQKRFKVERMDSERALLAFLLAKIHKLDPDVIVGHDLLNFDIDVLLNRLRENKVPNWSRIGRLKRTVIPKNNVGNRGSATCGRLLCDIKILAKELLRSKSYDLSDLTRLVLKKERVDLDTRTAYNSSAELFTFIEWSLLDASYCLQLVCEINAVPLALQITNIAGNIMSRTLLGGRSERNEFLLLHAFTERDYIVPDKQYGKKTTNSHDAADDGVKALKTTPGRRKRPAYSGGLVLEPKKGFYDKYVLLMDFNSLYPSIIQEFNVCFTTMSTVTENMLDETVVLDVSIPAANCPTGVLPTEIRKLVESRRQVKQLLNTPDLSADLRLQYDIRQKALKLTANSMYGCLGFANSRFYAKNLAAFITAKGREILLQTKELVQKIGLDVIYGDTDSLMINSGSTDLEHIYRLGNKLKAEINKLYRNLEIDIDGIFKSMLLLNKKKYAALSIQKLPNGELKTTEEVKGLDVVRRDWSQLASDAGRFVIHKILSGLQTDQVMEAILTYLHNLRIQIHDGSIPLSMFTITKQLTKNPEDYPDKNNVPHVNVALRLNSRSAKKIRQGDTVAYVICQDGSPLSAMQRAFHLDELKTNDNLKIDNSYYLSQQVHPVVSRLCDPFEGLDAAVIAECLDLDPTSYKRVNYVRPEEVEEEAMLGSRLMQSDVDRFTACEPFSFPCSAPNCGQENVLRSPFRGEGVEMVCGLSRCANPDCNLSPAASVNNLNNLLTRSIRQFIQKYYRGWLACEDPICSNRTRNLSRRCQGGQPICTACRKGSLHQEFSETQLYNQLCFYSYIFDPEKASKALTTEEDGEGVDSHQCQHAYEQLRATVASFLDSSAYSTVDLTQLFAGLVQKRH